MSHKWIINRLTRGQYCGWVKGTYPQWRTKQGRGCIVFLYQRVGLTLYLRWLTKPTPFTFIHTSGLINWSNTLRRVFFFSRVASHHSPPPYYNYYRSPNLLYAAVVIRRGADNNYWNPPRIHIKNDNLSSGMTHIFITSKTKSRIKLTCDGREVMLIMTLRFTGYFVA